MELLCNGGFRQQNSEAFLGTTEKDENPLLAPSEPRRRKKGSVGERGLFRKVHFLEIPENLEILEFLENFPDCGKERRIRPVSRDSREFRDFRDSRDPSSEKTPFVVMTPFSGPSEPTFPGQPKVAQSGLKCKRAWIMTPNGFLAQLHSVARHPQL